MDHYNFVLPDILVVNIPFMVKQNHNHHKSAIIYHHAKTEAFDLPDDNFFSESGAYTPYS